MATGSRVVCISRAIAARGEEVGDAVARRLGFRYVDEQVVTRAAAHARVEPDRVAEVERRKKLLDRVLDVLSFAPETAQAFTLNMGVPVDAMTTTPWTPRADDQELRVLIRTAIHEIAAEGDAVIVAHAASMALAGKEGVLRVLVTASPATRARRLAEQQRIGAGEAERAVAASDRERREYFRRFYDVDEELPTHYDVVFNTDVLEPKAIVDLIVAAVRPAV